MVKRPAQVAETASEQARRVHAFMIARGLSARGWGLRAGLGASTLSELYSGRTQSLTFANLARLARSAEASLSDIVGPDIGAVMPENAAVPLADVSKAVLVWAQGIGLSDPVAAAQEVIQILAETSLPTDSA